MRPLAHGRQITPGTTILEHLHRSNGLDVYDAWNDPRACRVVVKTLRPDRLHDATARVRLLREGRRLKRLSHPHIVRAYEVHDGKRPAVHMETLTGRTLDHLIHQSARPLSAAELVHLGSHLAAALGYLHHEGILHLDLKPANVIAEAGRAKLIDLSHARAVGHMRAGNGTWCYMAPEQARGGRVDAAADVWGLGMLLHEAAVRRRALEEMADELDVDDPQLAGRVPSLRRERPRLVRPLATLVDACLEPEPVNRPTLADVRRRLDELA